MVRFGLQMHPAGFESTLRIPREGRRWRVVLGIKEDPQTHHDLKTIADPQNQSVLGLENAQHVCQPRLPLHGRNPTGSDIVTVTKTTRKTEDLKRVGQCRLVDELIYVNSDRLGSCQFESISGFDVAVGSRCSNNQRFWLGHPDRLSGYF